MTADKLGEHGHIAKGRVQFWNIACKSRNKAALRY